MNAPDPSRAMMAASDTYLLDASSEHQSERGRWDAAFDSGYLALLSVLSPLERDVDDHPNEIALLLASERLGVDADQGRSLLRMRYAAERTRSFEGVLSWATRVRAAAKSSRTGLIE
jgi:hypothetical protein